MKRVLLFLCCLLTAGCSYYRITDPATKSEYITRDGEIVQSNYWQSSGFIRFRDLRTGKEVNLQQYEKEVISQQEAEDQIAAYGGKR